MIYMCLVQLPSLPVIDHMMSSMMVDDFSDVESLASYISDSSTAFTSESKKHICGTSTYAFVDLNY